MLHLYQFQSEKQLFVYNKNSRECDQFSLGNIHQQGGTHCNILKGVTSTSFRIPSKFVKKNVFNICYICQLQDAQDKSKLSVC